MKILLIDDEPSLREELKFLLNKKGYDVISAGNCVEAFDIAKNIKLDLVITDVLMPDCNGFEIILHMHQNYPEVKIITISGGGWAPPELHLESAKLLESDGQLAKPFPIKELKKEIKRVMKIKKL